MLELGRSNTEVSGMSSIKRSATESTGPLSRLEFGRKVLKREAEAIESLADRIGQEYLAAVDLILGCTGSVSSCSIRGAP